MEILKTNYNVISQLFYYFKSLEGINEFSFSQKRRLMKFNEELEKEHKFFSEELQKIANEHCEKDEAGNFIATENGGQKIKEGEIEIVNKKLTDLYLTAAEIQYSQFKLPEKYFENLKCDAATIKVIEENFLEE